MANEKLNCNQMCHWNDSSDGCIKPNGRICPMSHTEPDASGWGQVKVANEKRLIDANALLQSEVKRCRCIPTIGSGYSNETSFKLILDEAPTVDAVEVVHGRWVLQRYYGGVRKGMVARVICSECGYPNEKTNYCPQCGSDMRGGEDG